MARAKHLTTGKIGEAVARQYLIDNGHTIVDSSYQKKWGEIDIVSQIGELLVFVEVKAVACASRVELATVRQRGIYRPEQHLTREKRQRLRRVIQTWCAEHNRSDDVRVDVLSVYTVSAEKFAAVEWFTNVELA